MPSLASPSRKFSKKERSLTSRLARSLARPAAHSAFAVEAGERLYWAARDDDASALRLHLSEGAPADWRLPANGHTPLIAAAYNDSVECVRLLVAAGADVDAASRQGTTALLVACQYCREAIAEALVAAGASLRGGGGPALPAFVAAQTGAAPVLALLLRARASPDERDPSDGATALYVACQNSRAACVGELLDAGAGMEVASSTAGRR